MGTSSWPSLSTRECFASSRRSSSTPTPRWPRTRLMLGTVHNRRGDLDGAEREFRHALGIHEETYGKDHPEVAASLSQLANVSGSVAMSTKPRPFTAGHSRFERRPMAPITLAWQRRFPTRERSAAAWRCRRSRGRSSPGTPDSRGDLRHQPSRGCSLADQSCDRPTRARRPGRLDGLEPAGDPDQGGQERSRTRRRHQSHESRRDSCGPWRSKRGRGGATTRS